MPIVVECQNCESRFRVEDRRAGTSIPCRHCDHRIPIPANGPNGARRPPAGRRAVFKNGFDDDDFEDDDFDKIPAHRNPGGVPWQVWVFGGVSIVAVLALVVGFIVLSKGDDADDDSATGNTQAAKERAVKDWVKEIATARRSHDETVRKARTKLEVALTRATLRPNVSPQERLQLLREQQMFVVDDVRLPLSLAVRQDVEVYRTQRTRAELEMSRKLGELIETSPEGVDPRLLDETKTARTTVERIAMRLSSQKLDNVASNSPPGLPGGLAGDRNRRGRNGNPRRDLGNPAKPKGGIAKPPSMTKGNIGPLFEWKIEVDPSPEPLVLPKDYQLSISLPPGTSVQNILFAKGHSPYVAIGKNHSETEVRTVFDLRTGKVIGRVGGYKDFSNNGVLDPYGQFFARATTTSKGVFLWDLAANQMKGTLPLETVNNKYLGFGGKKRVLAIGGGFAKPLNVWKLPSGEAERTIEITKHFDAESITLSPGGRYVAFNETIYKPAVRVYDLGTGKLAGSLSTGFGGSGSANCTALEFSPDGKELAGLFNFGFDEWIACWDVATGKQLLAHQFVNKMRFKLGVTHPFPLQWFPNKKRWLLYGQELFDREAMKIVFSIPGERGKHVTRKVLDDTHITSVIGRSRQMRIISLTLDEKLLQK